MRLAAARRARAQLLGGALPHERAPLVGVPGAEQRVERDVGEVRVAVPRVAVRERELRALGDGVDEVRGSHRREVEAGQQRELLEQHRALPPRPGLADRVAVVVERDRHLERRRPARQVVAGEQPVLVRGEDRLRHPAAVERVARRVDARLARAAARAREPLERLGQRAVAEQPAGLGHRGVELGRARPLGRQPLRRRADPRHDRVAPARVSDRRLQHVRQLPRAEVAQHQAPGVERARHDGGVRPLARHEIEAERPVRVDRRRLRRRPLPAHHDRLAALHGPHDRRHVAARPVEVRLDHLQHEARRHRRVERVAAALEHRHPRARREPVRRGDHPERPAQLGPGRERHPIRSSAAPTTDSASIAWCS